MIVFTVFVGPEEAALISIDLSIIPAIVIFLVMIAALNTLLFQPLLRVQAEREARTTGQMAQVEKETSHHLELFERYQETIKNARLEGYRHQEKVRAEAMSKRAELLTQARSQTEQQLEQSRSSIQSQVETAKKNLDHEVQEIARGIAANILQRPA